MSSLGPLQNLGPAHIPTPAPPPPSLVPAPPPSASSSSIQRWISANRKALAYTAGGLALLGAGVAGYRYYYLSSHRSAGGAADDDSVASAGSSGAGAKDKKKKKKKSKGSSGGPKGVNDEGGPLLEEVASPAVKQTENVPDEGKSPAVDDDKKDGALSPSLRFPPLYPRPRAFRDPFQLTPMSCCPLFPSLDCQSESVFFITSFAL